MTHCLLWIPALKKKKKKKKNPLMIDIQNLLLVFYILNEYELNNSD